MIKNNKQCQIIYQLKINKNNNKIFIKIIMMKYNIMMMIQKINLSLKK